MHATVSATSLSLARSCACRACLCHDPKTRSRPKTIQLSQGPIKTLKFLSLTRCPNPSLNPVANPVATTFFLSPLTHLYRDLEIRVTTQKLGSQPKTNPTNTPAPVATPGTCVATQLSCLCHDKKSLIATNLSLKLKSPLS